jgi:hypothetical protein
MTLVWHIIFAHRSDYRTEQMKYILPAAALPDAILRDSHATILCFPRRTITITLMDPSTNPAGRPEDKNLFTPDMAVTPDQTAAAPPAPTPEVPTTARHDQPAAQPDVEAEQSIVDPQQPPQAESNSVTWTASEFVAHHKSITWYLLLALGAIVLAAVVWLLTKDTFATAVVIIGALLLGVYATHKPRQLSYALDDQGLTIGGRYHPFAEFRSFTIVPEGAFLSIELSPLKRFATFTTIYFDPADEDRITELLSAHLPFEERISDPIDQLVRRIRL